MGEGRDEYHWLRRHIHGQFTLVIQVFTVSVVAAVALIGYVFTSLTRAEVISSAVPFLFLTPLAITIPCAYLISSLRREIFKWGMYIKVYLEDGKDLKYETELDKYRKKFPERESFNLVAITYWVLLLFVCSPLFGYALYKAEMPFLWLIVLIVPLGFLLHWYMSYKDIPYRCSVEYNRGWEQIKGMNDVNHQAQQNNNADDLRQKLDALGSKMDTLLRVSETSQKHQSIFAAALSGLALAATLTIFGSQTNQVDVVRVAIFLWALSLCCFIYLASKKRNGHS